jgi:hypothetical protein
MSHYIERIHINEVRHLRDVDIDIGSSEDGSPKHLILTGPNGSGKTSVLQALVAHLEGVPSQQWLHIPSWEQSLEQQRKIVKNLDSQLSAADNPRREQLSAQRSSSLQSMKGLEQVLLRYKSLDLQIPDLADLVPQYSEGAFLLAFFPADRRTAMAVPTGVKKVQPKQIYGIVETARAQFLEYLVHLRAQRSFSRDDNDLKAAEYIDDWFEKFEGALKELYDDPRLQLLFDRDNYRHTIQLGDGRDPFDLNQLADGYHAMLSIVNELILRMEAKAPKVYDLPGIVLIDEIETHLHIEMQKKALPFLTAFFPKIQFVVTTHSPFVLLSVKDAVIFDLASRMRVEDLSGYSSEAIIQGYFGQNKYSQELHTELDEYKVLWARKDALNGNERDRFDDLKFRLHELPKAFSPELETALRDIEGA